MILAPSKTMDFEADAPSFIKPSKPVFITEANHIAATLERLSQDQLEIIMKISPAISKNVHVMYASWSHAISKSALWAYRGDVYKGMYADTLSQADVAWANDHLLIMSGLYGLLRPTDQISAYRLEMKTTISINSSKDLYAYWGRRLGDYVEQRADGVLLNLCSDEYGKAVTRHISKNVAIVTPLFFDNRPNGTVGTAPIYNKMMRGVMARWVIDNRINDPEGLKAFTGHGYSYDSTRSTVNAPAFYRALMKPLVF